MKQEYKTGGWVKCIAEARTAKTEPYNQFKLGEYYQIKCIDSNNMITTSEGYKMYTISNFAYDTECEWVGMEKPTEKSIVIEVKQEGVGILVIGEWYMIGEWYLPITSCWLGEGDRFKSQGPYKILVKSADCATRVNDGTKDIRCNLSPRRFRKCRPEELPKTEPKVEHKEEKWEPKAGEYAVMTKSYRDIPIGKVVKIIKSQEVLDCWFVDFPGRENDYAPYLHCMRKALSHEIPQEKTKTMYTPQIGDWVLLSATADGWGASKEDARNQTVQITRINDNHMWFKPKVGREVSTRITEIVRKVDGPGTPVNAMDEILAEAKRRFPAGTKFVPQDMHGEVYTVSSEERYYEGMASNVILVKTKEGVGGQYLYHNGKWAEIVTESYSSVVMDHGTGERSYSASSITTGVERLPSEIIVKKKEKVGRRLMIS